MKEEDLRYQERLRRMSKDKRILEIDLDKAYHRTPEVAERTTLAHYQERLRRR